MLFLWIAGILFPMAWLGRFSPGFRQAFDAMFGPVWMHILMHAGLFAVLAMLLASQVSKFRTHHGWMPSLLTLGAILGVGALQEALQSLSGGAFLPWAAAFDLGVDLAGGLVGWVIVRRF